MGSLYFYATPRLAHQQKGKKGIKGLLRGKRVVLNMTFGTLRTLMTFGTFRTFGTFGTLRPLVTFRTFRTLRTLRTLVNVC